MCYNKIIKLQNVRKIFWEYIFSHYKYLRLPEDLGCSGFTSVGQLEEPPLIVGGYEEAEVRHQEVCGEVVDRGSRNGQVLSDARQLGEGERR